VSALAVYLERADIATVVVGLIKPHLEKTKPPRSLFVPFELGRPLGAYVDGGEFQKRVLRTAFALLDRTDGPVILEEFPDDDPSEVGDTDWQAPVLNDATSVVEEVAALMPAWEQAKARFGRSTTGLSGLAPREAADYLERFDTQSPASNPNDDMSDLLRMRFCADDVKAFFAEAAMAKGSPSSRQVGDWFWGSTRASAALRRIAQDNTSHENKVRALVCSKFLVPGARQA